MSRLLAAIFSGLSLAFLATWVICHAYPSLVRNLRNLLAEPRGASPAAAWRGRTVALVVIAWFVVSLVTPTAYVLLREKLRSRTVRAGVGLKTDLEKPGLAPPSVKTASDFTTSTAPPLPRKSMRVSEGSFLSLSEKIALVSVINGLLLVILPFILRLDTRAVLKALGLSSTHLARDLKAGAVAFLVVTPVVFTINLLALQIWRQNKHPVELMLRKGLGPWTVALAYLSAMVLAPVAEELLFRGVIQAWLRRVWVDQKRAHAISETTFDGAWALADSIDLPFPTTNIPGFRALPRPVMLLTGRIFRPLSGGVFSILLTSILFALLHADQMPAPFAIFALSLMLGWLYDRTGGVVAPTVLHALFNGFNTTLMLLSLLLTPPTSPTEARPKNPPVGSEKSVESQDFSLSFLGCDDTF